jgi:hypothetical protein
LFTRLTRCAVCGFVGAQITGVYKAIEIDGNLFDCHDDVAKDLSDLNDEFKAYITDECHGELSSDRLREFLTKQHSQSGSHPLSRMFARRIRARKCKNCGHLVELSRLP